MSTDMQRYSIENQSDAIALYAARRGLSIVRSYEDSGRSGLRLDGRESLKALIDDVKSGRADFNVILVYDVSRWGRFQDSDESAYYEFVCKEAGVKVEYCAEEFENDGSLTAAVLKAIKRAMAGEYSRELSQKVSAGQSRIAALGFHVGAAAGYGLRRCLLDEHGNRKMELRFGQRKSLQTERVILVPGPAEEVKTVNHLYDMFIDERKSLQSIADTLNSLCVPNICGRPWSRISVGELLKNEKYAGSCIYNRGTKKLGTMFKRNPDDKWIRVAGAFEPVVSRQRFEQAQRQFKENACAYHENDMLDRLAALWCREKELSRDLIEQSANVPAANTYKKHFGSLTNAYRRIGYGSAQIANLQHLRNLRRAVCNEMAEQVAALGGSVEMPSGCNCQLRINNELNVTVVTGHTSPRSARCNQNEWRFSYRSQRKPDILIVARVDLGGSSVRDYFILPYIFSSGGKAFTLSGSNYSLLEAFRADSLAVICKLFSRAPITTVELNSEPQALGVDPDYYAEPANDPYLRVSRARNRGMRVVSDTRVISKDRGLVELLHLEDVQTVPQFFVTTEVHEGDGSPSELAAEGMALEFVITWTFLVPLFANPTVAKYFEWRWPGFMMRAQDAFSMLATDGAFSHAISMHRRHSRPRGRRCL